MKNLTKENINNIIFICLFFGCILFSKTSHAAFIINSNGTVSDDINNLVWDRCPLGFSGPTCIGSILTFSWENALLEVSARNSANHLGFNDWRLPNRIELESLIKIDAESPAVDGSVFPNSPVVNSLNAISWSSTTNPADTSTAWYVSFFSGNTEFGSKSNNLTVRLVRGGGTLNGFDKIGINNYVASVPANSSLNGSVNTTLSGGGANCALGYINYQSTGNATPAPPSGITFPAGFVNFTTTNCDPGGTISVTITYPNSLPHGTQFYKYGPSTPGALPSWYIHPAVINGNTITYSVLDNGQGDSDATLGKIIDPAGPGFFTGGINNIPTLNKVSGAILLGLIFLLLCFQRRLFKLKFKFNFRFMQIVSKRI